MDIKTATIQEQVRKARWVSKFEADCREIAEAAIGRGELMPALIDREAYRKIVQDGVEAGLISFPEVEEGQEGESLSEGTPTPP